MDAFETVTVYDSDEDLLMEIITVYDSDEDPSTVTAPTTIADPPTVAAPHAVGHRAVRHRAIRRRTERRGPLRCRALRCGPMGPMPRAAPAVDPQPPKVDNEPPIVSCSRSDIRLVDVVRRHWTETRIVCKVELTLSMNEEPCMMCFEPTTFRFVCSNDHAMCNECRKSAVAAYKRAKSELRARIIANIHAFTIDEMYDEIKSLKILKRSYTVCAACRERNLTVKDPTPEKINKYLLKLGIVP